MYALPHTTPLIIFATGLMIWAAENTAIIILLIVALVEQKEKEMIACVLPEPIIYAKVPRLRRLRLRKLQGRTVGWNGKNVLKKTRTIGLRATIHARVDRPGRNVRLTAPL